MKFDRDWVSRFAQCPEGMAWGLVYVEGGPKDLAEALVGFKRADFLLWFLVKAGAITPEMAFDFCYDLAASRINATEALESLPELLINPKLVRGRTAHEAEVSITAGQFSRGHEFSAACFLARFKLQLDAEDFDEALKDGQCVLNNLVAASTGSLIFETENARQVHAGICDWLRSRVLVAR